ncbi:hypothetical protein CAPTEDRAFT_139885 [Capitella teleta]|uniref:C-type lectin domain-containing protein n=1 Tax=Capitella teleta TaxID=283909 RepID=R7U4Q3_CAPTE|nr:hypothetical protein CAPTEDRAFT_139885 [Capitella teleta]|eukprot:ELU01345.1 hypothetical protein CAPTEDRAFT_139885 [Capitella teleta]
MGGSCYLINHDKLTWEEARENCKDVDADLASITGTNDQSYITALVKSMTGSSSYWTGGNDLDQESGWKWSDGSPFAYFYWADGEPNDAGGEEWCIEVETGKDAKWNDHHCTEPRASICKKSGV